jgi:hypothetical protein
VPIASRNASQSPTKFPHMFVAFSNVFPGSVDCPGTTSAVIVEMTGSIKCNDLRGSFTLSDSSPVADERLSAVVAAHQQGLNDVTRQLLDQIRLPVQYSLCHTLLFTILWQEPGPLGLFFFHPGDIIFLLLLFDASHILTCPNIGVAGFFNPFTSLHPLLKL